MHTLTLPLLPIAAALAAAVTGPSGPLAQETASTDASAQETRDAQSPTDLQTLQKQFSTWKLRTRTDATWKGAEAELARLIEAVEKAALAAPRDETMRGFLSDAYARSIQWSAQRGDLQATAARIVDLRLQAAKQATMPRQTVVLAAAMTLTRLDVSKIEDSLPEGAQRASLPATGSHTEDVVIARAVREAIMRKDSEFLHKLGGRAIPALVDLAYVMDGTPIPAAESDPLEWVFTMDAGAGLDVALELLRRDEYLLQKAVQFRLAESSAFAYDSVWNAVGTTDWQLKKPEWNEILRRLLASEDAPTSDLQEIVRSFAKRGAVPRELGPACVAVLAASGRNSISSQVFAERGAWFLTDLMESANPKLRQRAVQGLLYSEHPNVVLQLVGDPDLDVRRELAKAVYRFSSSRWSDEARKTSVKFTRSFDLDGTYGRAVRSLVLDPDSNVRGVAAVSVLRYSQGRNESVLDAKTLRELISVAGRNEQDTLIGITRYLPEEERLPTVLHYVDVVGRGELDHESKESILSKLFDVESYGLTPSDNFWAIANKVAATIDVSEDLESSISGTAMYFIENDKISAGEFVDRLEKGVSAKTWGRAISNLVQTSARDNFDGHWIARTNSGERARLVRMFADVKNPSSHKGPVIARLQHGFMGISGDDLIAILEDEKAPMQTRAWVATEIVMTARERLTSEHVPALARIVGHDDFDKRLGSFYRDSATRQLPYDILDAMLADPNVSNDRLARIRLPLTRDTTVDLVLDRFPPESWKNYEDDYLLQKLIIVLVERAAENGDPRLAFANIRGSKLQGILAYYVGTTRSKALFPLLADILRTAHINSQAYTSALDAVTGYLNDDAAALLIEIAHTTSNEKTRQRIMASLDQILAWQDAASRFERSRDAAARRIDAIDELIAMSEDTAQPSTVRAEALRGLGLLGATEELPRLVRALTSDDEAIRTAARDAIDRLHADAGDEKD